MSLLPFDPAIADIADEIVSRGKARADTLPNIMDDHHRIQYLFIWNCNMPSVDWALDRLREFQATGNDLDICLAAGVLMENCVNDERITWREGYAFLDFPGATASCGARILYIKTGRDGVGTRPAHEYGVEFSSDRADWTNFLIAKGYVIGETESDAG